MNFSKELKIKSWLQQITCITSNIFFYAFLSNSMMHSSFLGIIKVKQIFNDQRIGID